jgi:hypothetical protein
MYSGTALRRKSSAMMLYELTFKARLHPFCCDFWCNFLLLMDVNERMSYERSDDGSVHSEYS